MYFKNDSKKIHILRITSRAAWFFILALVIVSIAALAQAQPGVSTSGAACDRACMTDIVEQTLKSMAAHDPDTLPLANLYRATENSHPSSLRFMNLWRTVSEYHKPDLLAIDVPAGQAFVMSQISEGGSLSIFWGRIKVVDRKITELEFYIDRSRGDDGFEFATGKISPTFRQIMSPPAKRKKATREELTRLGKAIFDASIKVSLETSPDCKATEAGANVVDPGLDDVEPQLPEGMQLPAGMSSPPVMSEENPAGCMWFDTRPTDPGARIVVVDEELGIVAAHGMVPGKVYAYPLYGKKVSAFIPDAMKSGQEAQEQWIQRRIKDGKSIINATMPATGDSIQLLQIYNDKIQGNQINVHLSGPGMKDIWGDTTAR